MYIIAKIIASAIVIAAVTEIARRFPSYGGMIAALPLVSLLSMIWLYVQGEPSTVLSKFALGVLWGFPATAVLLIIVYFALQHSVHLFFSIILGIGGWMLFIILQDMIVKSVRTLFLS
ncbi:DUF3147 family protein [Cytobacillus purgationiresistens]|uniref:DUF3147 family protein n=1 Tax=Cytobacillus purgationiresistens TaxID=863449 RepID=A0ABU0ANK2_9BACI|nr:DUF3147 family protein [Cytobacillus purgationiresistens]MDQ0272837.1 hypothetical protein [Cytobacillus purgationiresistens]